MVQPSTEKHSRRNNKRNPSNVDPSQIIIQRLLSKMADFHPLPACPPEAAFSPRWFQYMQQAEQRAKLMEPAQLPSMDHLTYLDFEHVYEPSADTYLMLDAICCDLSLLKQHSSLRHILEIGCGSGLSITYLATQIQQLQGPQHQFVSIVTDVNLIALRVACRTAQENAVNDLEAIQCDLASSLLPRCSNTMDVILFNPPYVPTPDEEVGGTGIEASWAGGVRGRRVVDRALPQMAQLLRQPHGVAYLVTVDDNDPEQMAETLSQLGLIMRPVVRRKAHNEYLTVHRLSWKPERDL